ncbi:amino acid ABC transporter substrate-binding protein [Thalassospira tepidiphila]|nr:amino acid ABC transporter substrate-binding protein [Thalassospira tepidiphila]
MVVTGVAVCLLAILFAVTAADAHERIPVKVGAYEYSDVFYYEDGQPKGVVPQLIKLLNDLQEDYEFRLVETSSRRRYEDLLSGQLDLVLLDSATWEWQGLDVNFSDTLFTEVDLYVALASGEDPQALFSNVTSYPILCVLGFHYGFAGFNADPAFLQENFDVLLRYNEQEVLDGLLAGEAQIGIISAGFLTTKMSEQPELIDKLVFSVMPGGRYDLVSVLSRNSAISLEHFNQLIAKLKDSGAADHLWQHHHPDLPS